MGGNRQRGHITGDGHQELQYLRFHNLALEPIGEDTAQFYYNTATKLLGIYDSGWTYLPKTYLDLYDTTDTTYVAKTGFVPMVNSLETGLELVDSEIATFLILADTPSTYIGQGGKVVRVNVAETALEFLSTASLVTGVTDGVFNLDVSAGLLTVTPYIAQTSAAFDSSATNPVGTTRLNYNGYFYATRLNARASDYAVIANATGADGVAVLAQADTITSTALSGASSLGTAIYGLTVDGLAFKYRSDHSTNNDAYKLGSYTRAPGVATLSGIGIYNSYSIQNANLALIESGRIYNKLTTTTHLSEVSSFEWWLVNAGVLAKKMELKGSGQLLLAGYGIGSFSLGTPTYYLQVDANGNILEGALGAGSMVYPVAGIALSTGSSWGASIINNSTQWNTAYGWGNHAGLYAIAPAANTADYIPQWNGTNSKVLKDGLAVPAGGLVGNTALAAKQPRLTITGVKTGNYSANADEYVPYDISASTPILTLPTAPATGTIVQTKLIAVDSTTILEVKTGGSDIFNIAGGNTSIYYNLFNTVASFVYNAFTGIWYVETTAPPSAFAMGFPGIDAQTPITNSDISIDTSTFVLTITPPLGYFYVNVAGGNGKNIRIRKTGVISFPAFTDTSGMWYFYFDNTGAPITTQVVWTSEDFANISPVYRIIWNATLAGAARLVRRFVEYHLNDIPHDTHVWMHLHGAIWAKGLDIASNVITSPTSPASNGSNAVIALTTGTCIDDNLAYTITNDSTPTNDWEQDLGDITPASLNATNSALFQVRYRNGAGLVFFLPATRFPFDWNSGTNIPQWITSTGTRTPVTNTYHFVYFVYITQDPKVGTAISIVSAPAEYSNITNARAVSWTDIQNTYTYLNDGEIRPLYKLIFEYKTSYGAGTKYSALREIADLRRAAVTSTTVASGSIPASSVTVIPTGDIASTNVQSALAEIDSEKQTKRSLLSTTLPINVAETTLSGASFIPPITSEPLFFNVTEVVGGTTIIQHDVIDRCVVNGGYYDVVITPLVDAITAAKITVLV